MSYVIRTISLLFMLVLPGWTKLICSPDVFKGTNFHPASCLLNDAVTIQNPLCFPLLLEIADQKNNECYGMEEGQGGEDCNAKLHLMVREILALRAPDEYFKESVSFTNGHHDLSLPIPPGLKEDTILMDVNRNEDIDNLLKTAKEEEKKCENGKRKHLESCINDNVYDIVRMILWRKKAMATADRKVTVRRGGAEVVLPLPLEWSCESLIYDVFGKRIGDTEKGVESCRHQFLPNHPRKYWHCVTEQLRQDDPPKKSTTTKKHQDHQEHHEVPATGEEVNPKK